MLRVRLLLPLPCQSAVTTSQLNCPLLFCKITLKGICKIVEYITFGGRFTVLGFDPNRMRMKFRTRRACATDIADAVLYLTEARQVTGEVLHFDGGAHVGKW